MRQGMGYAMLFKLIALILAVVIVLMLISKSGSVLAGFTDLFG
ncbi:MAG: hypothetical protein ACQESG_02805 [Nanobdellota archaeon]